MWPSGSSRCRGDTGGPNNGLKLRALRQNGGRRTGPSPESAYQARSKRTSVLTFDSFQQRIAFKATTACGQVVVVFAFLAERLVFLGGLVR